MIFNIFQASCTVFLIQFDR